MENVTDGSLKNVVDTNVVVKGLNKEKVDCQTLDKFFTENVGKVKCCKVSKTIEDEGGNISCRSNGYGFVNFETKELCDKAIEVCNGKELEGSELIVEKYSKDVKRETKFNNVYVRGFDENFTEEQLIELFKTCGELGSVKIMKDQEGVSKKFGFVCFQEPESAVKSVENLHNKVLEDGNTLYVAKFEKKQNRWAAIKKSLSRANLYVRNFDKNVTEEDLKTFFGGENVVRNVRIMTTDVNREDGVVKESKQFGFVSFNKPQDAADIIQKYNSEELEFNNKQLYVNYYEDKAARKKRLATKKDKPDSLMGILDPSIMGGASGEGQSNMMEYFMQIFQQYFKNYNGGGGQQYNNYNNNYGQHYGNYSHGGGNYQKRNRGGHMGHRGNYNQASSYGSYGGHHSHGGYPPVRQPRQDHHHSYAAPTHSTIPPPTGPPPTAATQHMVTAPIPQPMPPVNTPSIIYSQQVKSVFSTPDFESKSEEEKREKIGEEIYNYVLEKAGEESAPKITGMIIDLPFADLIKSIQTYEGLQDKINEGLDLLQDDQ